jgi:hypothetical protein
MVDMPDALYLPTGESDTFDATDLTEGPWAPGVQHGGPPSALLARAVERTPTTIAGASQVVRISYDILGPMPVTRLRTPARVVRPGRSVELVEAALVAGDRTVMRARAWRIKVALTRQPTGDWVRVAARSTLDGSGAGLAETSLADRSGRFGRGAQALMVGPR